MQRGAESGRNSGRQGKGQALERGIRVDKPGNTSLTAITAHREARDMPTKHSLGKQAKGVNFNRVKGYAQKMRDNPTPAEAKFHQYLKQSYLGHISTQHHFVGRRNAFILDFYLPEKRIAFEIDGWHHYNDPKQIEKDKFRDNYCRVRGIRIVRLKNQEASDKSIAQSTILKALGAPNELVSLVTQPMPLVRLRKRNEK